MSKVNEKMNVLLADLNVLYRKVQNYHWNVDGRNFFTIHAKLEEYYNEINEQIDEIAERILSIKARQRSEQSFHLNGFNAKAHSVII